MYEIFSRTILNDNGKMFVRDHENDHDSQEVYKYYNKTVYILPESPLEKKVCYNTLPLPN